MSEKRLKLFKFGYGGLGNSTKKLVETVNAVERERGCKPPVWVDIRARSSVRAAGFNGRRLAKRVGERNYEVIKELGNDHVLHGGDGVRIIDPSKAERLLDVALKARWEKRHVIFFCECPEPKQCHRTKVGRTHLVRVAERRGISVEVVEWPGGQPERIDLKIRRDWLKGASIEFPRKPKDRQWLRLAGLAAGSLVRLSDSTGWKKTVAVMALRFERGAWRLPLVRAEETKRILTTADEVSSWRAKAAYEPHYSETK